MKRAVAAALMVAWLLAAQAAWGLQAVDQKFEPLRLEPLGANVTASDLPALYLYQAPKDEIAPLKAGLMLYGGATSFNLGGQGGSVYRGGLYFSRSVISADPLATRRALQPGLLSGALGLQSLTGSDRQYTVRSSSAVWQDLAYKGSKWSLTGSHKEVAADFEGLADLVASRSDAASLQSLLGMNTTSLDFSMQPGRGLSLTSHYDRTVNDKPNDGQRGLTQSNMKSVLDLALGSATKLTGTYEAVSKMRNGSGESKELTTFMLSHDFGGGLMGSVTRQLMSSATNGSTSGLAATLGHFEYKPSARFGLKADLAEKQPDGGNPERSMLLDFNTLLGRGTSAMALTGQWQGKTVGAHDKTRENGLRLGLLADRNPLLQLALNYQSLSTSGPGSSTNNAKMDATVTSKLGRWGRLVAQTLNETASGQPVKNQRKLRFELAPGPLSMNAGFENSDANGATPAQIAFANMLWRTSKPLSQWAKEATGPALLPTADRFGLRTNIPWAAVPESGVELRFTSRSRAPDGAGNTRMLGYQTMLGSGGYLKLSLQENPVQIENNQEKTIFARRNLAELGMRVGRNLSVVGRSIKEEDLITGASSDTRLVAVRAQPGKRLSVLAGQQTLQGASNAGMSFLALQWKGSAMQDWAVGAACNTLFTDAEQFGYRKPPAWAVGEAGLQLQQFAARNDAGSNVESRVVSYQTMLGRSAYLKLLTRQNPLDDKNQILPVRQSMWEFGALAAHKWTFLLRGVQEECLDKNQTLSYYIFGVRSNLSQREKLETTIAIDGVTGDGAYRRNSLGLEYSRWVNADHMLSLKGVYGQQQEGGGRDDVRWELAYRKPT